jgi:hypothetical protein
LLKQVLFLEVFFGAGMERNRPIEIFIRSLGRIEVAERLVPFDKAILIFDNRFCKEL